VNPAVIDLLECPNCGTPPVRRYCTQCGQKVGPINPTVHDFVHIAYGRCWWVAAGRTVCVFVAYNAVILVTTIAIATALAGCALSR
jgi:hypothetical protein